MSTATMCKHCGFSVAATPEGFCSENCKIGWKRRTSDPFTWMNYVHEAKDTSMSEETKQKLRDLNEKKKAAKAAEAKAFEEDNKRASEEQSF